MTWAGEEFVPCRRPGGSLPGLRLGTGCGTPALRTKRRAYLRLDEAGHILPVFGMDEKDMLLAPRPGAVLETRHHRGWPSVLLRPAARADQEPAHRIAGA